MRTTASSPAVGVVAARRTSIGLSYGLVVGFNTEWYHHAGPQKTPVPDCIGSIWGTADVTLTFLG
jgi:uncharacterized membrane protein YbjE (DUF340 family)